MIMNILCLLCVALLSDVIHTVGPIGEIPDKLQSCYRACLNLVKENNLKSVVRAI